MVGTILFINHFNDNNLIVQIYIDDNIFDSVNKTLCEFFHKYE